MADEAVYVLTDYLQSLDNLPDETKHIFDEISVKEMALHDLGKQIQTADQQIQSHVKSQGSHIPHPKEESFYTSIREKYEKSIIIQNEKVQLAERARAVLMRHIKRLDDKLMKLGPGFTPAELLNQANDLTSLSSVSLNSPAGASARQAPVQARNGVGRRQSSIFGRTASQNGGFQQGVVDGVGAGRPQRPTGTISKAPSVKAGAAAYSEAVSEEEEDQEEEDNEKYCFCQQGSYGQMVACDNEDCEREWFHMECVGLKAPPEGTWYCEACREKMGN
ncbi:ING family-like protein Png1 [Schizosaccharomyces osmophilus]|uniref:Chromatin modification-related protein n=1 Tax=Schizosaccharomyces osmophilus TaxID=2545709 RepID=A0AAF0AWA3_9SCHI|nr:ING family-like protein Png1 [Schizosaccharomyces osmophilus]WBW72709.1 ING family-like protein Png1 [Schizosaccharomyces osmophilus]